MVSIGFWRGHVWKGHGGCGGHGGRPRGGGGRVATKEEWHGEETVFFEQCVLKYDVYEQQEKSDAGHVLVVRVCVEAEATWSDERKGRRLRDCNDS